MPRTQSTLCKHGQLNTRLSSRVVIMFRLPRSSTDEWDRGSAISGERGRSSRGSGDYSSLALSEMLVVVGRGGGSKWTFFPYSATTVMRPQD